jgi:hypothetical protein
LGAPARTTRMTQLAPNKRLSRGPWSRLFADEFLSEFVPSQVLLAISIVFALTVSWVGWLIALPFLPLAAAGLFWTARIAVSKLVGSVLGVRVLQVIFDETSFVKVETR